MPETIDSPVAITVNIPHKITEQDIDDLFCTALDGAITYWAAGYRVKTHGENEGTKKFLSEKLAETINRGGTIEIAEDEEESGKAENYTWHEMDLAKLKEGFNKYFNDWVGKATTDPGDWDFEHADVIIQFAIFGEIVYG